MKSVTSNFIFIQLHVSLLKKVYALDILFYVLSGWYVFIEVPVADPFRPVVFIFLFCMFFVVIHSKTVQREIGGISYYRTIPFGSFFSSLLIHLAVVLPFTLLTAVTVVIGIVVGGNGLTGTDGVIIRGSHILFIYYAIKLITLPVMFFSRRHPAVLPGYFFLMIPIGISVLIFDEFFWEYLPYRYIWGMGQFVVTLYLLEMQIVRKCEFRT